MTILLRCLRIPNSKKYIIEYLPNSQNSFALVILNNTSMPTMYAEKIRGYCPLGSGEVRINTVPIKTTESPHNVDKLMKVLMDNKYASNKWVIINLSFLD